MVRARIVSFTTPIKDPSGRVDLAWEKPGDPLPLEVEVEADQPGALLAEVWTNIDRNDAPEVYRAVAMQSTGVVGNKARFALDLPVHKVGNYRATVRISQDGGSTWSWASQSGIDDLRVRPRDERHDALNIEEVHVGTVNFDPVTKKPGTFADMMARGSPDKNQKYTLEWLKSQGINAVWLMPPFEVSRWEHTPATDDAGSPYAVKDYFSIRTELSRDAQQVLARGGSQEDARAAALAEFKLFLDKAHKLGIQVMLDVALNHVGHNYDFQDLFIRYDAAGNETREVRRNDFSQVVVDPGQLLVIQQRIADPAVPDYMEHLAPWMYASSTGSPRGASAADEKLPGGFWEWHDTAQLNHGRVRWGYSWWDEAQPTPEQKAVQGWLERILRFWAVDVGVDGFRLDHLTGLPLSMLEIAANKVQADVDAHTPGRSLFLFGEDFHTNDQTRHFVDAGQGGWFQKLIAAKSAPALQTIVDDPHFHDLLSLSSHDEHRPLPMLGHDARATARLLSILQLLGGPAARVAGDNLGEVNGLAYKQYKGVAAVRTPNVTAKEIATIVGRAGKARAQLPALQDDNRFFLRPADGNVDRDLLAVARRADDPNEKLSLVLANLSNDRTRENTFVLDDETKKRMDPAKRYRVRDLMSAHPRQSLWKPPRTGADVLQNGIFARLDPYQVQVLVLEEA